MNANEIQIGGSHYKNAANYNHWDMATDTMMRHLEGAATKYLSRFGNKVGEPALKDLEKARHYVVKLIEVAQEDRIRPLAKLQLDSGMDHYEVRNFIQKFLETLEGPPAQFMSKQAMTVLGCWSAVEDLYSVRNTIDQLITQFSLHEVTPE